MPATRRTALLLTLAAALFACGDPPADDAPTHRWVEETPPQDAGADATTPPQDAATPDPHDASDPDPPDAAPRPDEDAPPDEDTPDAPDDPPLPRREAGHVFYEVFVRSFQDSDGDGVGDLRGLIQRLDYLNDGQDGQGDDLEVDGLWLMPIFPAPSYHGYDPTDYDTVAPELGTDADLDELLAACEARGLRVILDLVVNHTSSQHPWFLNAQNPASPRRDFYVWSDQNPGWPQPWGGGATWHPLDQRWYYGLFWSGMPDLNYRNPQVTQAMLDVARRWMRRGVAGFRIDAARYLVETPQGAQADQPETHAFFRLLRSEVDTARPDALLVAEAWADRPTVATYYGQGDELHQAFDFDLAYAIERALLRQDAAPLHQALDAIARQDTPPRFAATFLNNHDMDRLASRLGAPWALRAAHALLLTLPGQPYLYYGDELGMEQGPQQGDVARRTPMAWTAGPGGGFTDAPAPWADLPASWRTRNVADQLQRPDSLLRLTRDLIRLRRRHLALAEGDLTPLPQPDPALFVARRDHLASGETIWIVINLRNAPTPAPQLPDSTPLLGAHDTPLAPGEARLFIAR